MDNSKPVWLQNLQISDLEPIICHVLDQPTVKILDWHFQTFSGGAAEHRGRGKGVCRIAGMARDDHHEMPWSVVLKVMGPSERAINNDPTYHGYWKREVLAYQSGVLKQLPGNVTAPLCYAIQELPDGECRIWLEDIHEVDSRWAMEQHQLAARHLGQFNGAYLAGHPLPTKASWMLPQRTRQWVEMTPLDEEQLLQFSETDLGRRWLSKQSIDRMVRLWGMRKPLLATLDRLPTCFCHHDAFRRNLMLRQSDNGTVETVAIDWSHLGPGKVGQEIGITTAVDLFFMEVAARSAKELDETVFEGYSAGLRDAGWQGDLQLARFGYAVTAALTFGVAFTLKAASDVQDGRSAMHETIIGHPINDMMEQWAEMQPFLLDLGDEALALMPSI